MKDFHDGDSDVHDKVTPVTLWQLLEVESLKISGNHAQYDVGDSEKLKSIIKGNNHQYLELVINITRLEYLSPTSMWPSATE